MDGRKEWKGGQKVSGWLEHRGTPRDNMRHHGTLLGHVRDTLGQPGVANVRNVRQHTRTHTHAHTRTHARTLGVNTHARHTRRRSSRKERFGFGPGTLRKPRGQLRMHARHDTHDTDTEHDFPVRTPQPATWKLSYMCTLNDLKYAP